MQCENHGRPQLPPVASSLLSGYQAEHRKGVVRLKISRGAQVPSSSSPVALLGCENTYRHPQLHGRTCHLVQKESIGLKKGNKARPRIFAELQTSSPLLS